MSTPRLTQLKEQERKYSFSARAEKGELFGFSVYDGDLDVADPLILLFRTGEKKVHARRALEVFGGVATLVVYKTPTVTNAGTTVSIYNQDNSSDNTPELTVFSAPTVSANGTQCFQPTVVAGGEATPSRGTVSISDKTNRILDAETDYLVVITAASDNEIACYSVEFFEEL